jgi:hypothetical protein
MPGNLLHDLNERPVGDALAVRQATADQNTRAAAERCNGFAHQARLADPRRPEHRRKFAARRSDSAVECRLERRELASAADERGLDRTRESRYVREDADPSATPKPVGLCL